MDVSVNDSESDLHPIDASRSRKASASPAFSFVTVMCTVTNTSWGRMVCSAAQTRGDGWRTTRYGQSALQEFVEVGHFGKTQAIRGRPRA
jgi:hypothetical protein